MRRIRLKGLKRVWVVDMVSGRYPPLIRKLFGVFTSRGAEADKDSAGRNKPHFKQYEGEVQENVATSPSAQPNRVTRI